MEESTKATRRSTAALNKMTETLHEIMRAEDEESATPPPIPPKTQTAPKTQKPQK